MTKTEQVETAESEPNPTAELEAKLKDIEGIDRPAENPAVLRSIRAYNRAFKRCLSKDPDATAEDAQNDGRSSYLRAMPPLAGIKNIRDFIACVTFALITETISQEQAENYFGAARAALGAIRVGSKAS
jgi:hypothetical protein